ncbi:hypothetical protein N24_2686 [Corynebacterium suranareeae]|uniref:Uncharacterized protein n=1 Tax=Corynebacterium suranareeae TaxID=2506452 RepID=A0A169S305_9CORY|nr:hypothetical protein N24_2686 [Corynebacterium suranareeae]
MAVSRRANLIWRPKALESPLALVVGAGFKRLHPTTEGQKTNQACQDFLVKEILTRLFKDARCSSGDYSTRGNVMVNTVPSPGVLSTTTVPPWPSTRDLVIARPRPDPPDALDREESAR